MKQISRRTFLKSSGILGAALLVVPRWLICETVHYQPRHQVIYVSSKGSNLYSGASRNRSVATLTEAIKRINPRGIILIDPNHQEESKALLNLNKPCVIVGGLFTNES